MTHVSVTEAAARKVTELLAAEASEASGAGLRVDVRDGGCSGFQYALALDVPGQADRVFEQSGISVIVDQQALRFVSGAMVDYVETFQGSGFQVDNPNAVASCGCGSSFRVTEDEESPATR